MTATTSQTTGDLGSPSTRQRFVLWAMAMFLLAIFVGSFSYRMMHPSITVPGNTADQSHGPAPAGTQMSGEDMDVIGELMRKVSQDPTDLHSLEELSERFMQMRAWDNAERFLNQALVLEPGNTHVLFLLGVCAFQLDRPQEAADFFQQVAELDDTDMEARFNLAITLKHALDRPDEARKLLEEVAASPHSSEDLKASVDKELAD